MCVCAVCVDGRSHLGRPGDSMRNQRVMENGELENMEERSGVSTVEKGKTGDVKVVIGVRKV